MAPSLSRCRRASMRARYPAHSKARMSSTGVGRFLWRAEEAPQCAVFAMVPMCEACDGGTRGRDPSLSIRRHLGRFRLFVSKNDGTSGERVPLRDVFWQQNSVGRSRRITAEMRPPKALGGGEKARGHDPTVGKRSLIGTGGKSGRTSVSRAQPGRGRTGPNSLRRTSS